MSRTSTRAPFTLPQPVAAKLESVRRRMTRVGAWTALAAAAAVLFAAMGLAMVVDYLATLYDSFWRLALTAAALASAAVTLVGWLVWAGRRARRLEHVARQVDRRVPLLEERWSTVAEAAAAPDADATHPAMLRHVAAQAAGYDTHVVPREVVPLGALIKALLAVTAVTLVLLLAAALNWRQTSVLFRRFWAPAADISATVVTAQPGDAVVARGEPLVLSAALTGAQADEARLTLRGPDGAETSMTLIPHDEGDEGEPAQVSHRVRAVNERFEYRVRAGDGQTQWHSVTVAERPDIEAVQLAVTPPEYRNEKPLQLDKLPRRVSTVDGGELRLAIKPKRKLKSLELRIDEENVPLKRDEDGWYRWSTSLEGSFSLTPVLTEPHGLTMRRPPTTRVHVYPDQPPVVRIVSPDEEVNVRPDETIEIAFVAEDDNGLGAAELVVYQQPLEPGGEPIELEVTPIGLGDQAGAKRVQGRAELDLSAYSLADGASLSYAIRVIESRGTPVDASPNAVANTSAGAAGGAATPEGEQPPNDAVANSEPPAGSDTTADAVKPGALSERPVEADEQGASTEAVASAKPEQSNQPDTGALSGGEASGDDAAPGEGERVASGSEPTEASDEERVAPEGAPSAQQGGSTSHAVASSTQSSGDAQRPSENTPSAPTAPGGPAETAFASDEAAPAEAPSGGRQGSEGKSETDQVTDARAPEPGETEQAGERTRSSDAQSLTAQQDGTSEPSQTPGAASMAGDAANARGAPESMAENQPIAEKPDASPTGGASEPAAQASSESQRGQTGAQTSRTAQSSQSRSQSIASQTASAQNDPSASQDPGAPGDEMTRRALDVPQSSSSNQMRVNVDKWAGSFEGQQRQKLEIAIAPLIGEMRKELVRAQKLSRSVVDDLNAGQGWSARHHRDANAAQDATKKSLDLARQLQDMTRDTPYAFIGLQLVDIAEANVAPARQDFASSLRAEGDARRDAVRRGWQHVGRALDRLDELAGRFENARREYALADKAQQVKQMYRVFIEDAFALLGEQPPEGSKFQREMAEFELDEEYLARLKEVLEMRRELAAELARILSDDPRLRRRFMDNFRERADSLRLQLTKLRERQEALAREATIWSAMDGDKQPLALRILLRRRLEKTESIAQDVAKLADHFDAWMPLGGDPVDPQLEALRRETEDLSAQAQELAAKAAEAAADPEKLDAAVEAGAALTDGLRQFDAELRALGGRAALEGAEAFAINRLAETRGLITDVSAWTRGAEQFSAGVYHRAAAVEQYQLATDTDALAGKLGAVEQDMAALLQTPDGRLPAELAEHARSLLAALDEQATPHQLASAVALRAPEWPRAVTRQQAANKGLIDAEYAFDALIEGAIERLDQMPVQDPIASLLDDPTLDELLAQLEQELPLEEALGIPERPSNLQVIGDWMRPGQGGGGGGGGAMAAMIAAQLRAQQQEMNRASQRAQRRAQERLEEQKRVARGERPQESGPEPERTDWNVLVSELDDDLLQGRDKLPPEKYRTAIEQYYELIHREAGGGASARQAD